MKADKRNVSRETREQEKQEARKARNEEQAIEEVAIWADIEANSSKALEVASRKPVIPYTDELAIRICEELSNGVSLQRICARDDMPAQGTVYRMIAESPFFREIYTRARENAAHTLFDQMIDIADDCSNDLLADGTANNAAIARAKVRIDTRARVAGKLCARVYGERTEQLNQTVNIDSRSIIIEGRALDVTQRDQLRMLLLSARDKDGPSN